MKTDVNSLEFWLDIPEETAEVEFKRLQGDKTVAKILETIVAMTNTDGGVIVLGIDDPEKTDLQGEHRVFGIEENKELYDEIRRGLDHIQPGFQLTWPPTLITTSDEKLHAALIRVPKSLQYLYQYNGKAFVRLQKGNKELTAHESIQYAYARGFEHADTELVPVDVARLNTPMYQLWAKSRNLADRSFEEVLLATGLSRKHPETQKVQPTRAAVMLFAEFPSALTDTKCAIRILVYSGTIERYEQTPNLLQTPITIDGPSVELIKKAQDTVLSLLRTGVRIPSGFVTTYSLPERAVREAITNAVIHRDYHAKRDIEIRIFEDRVEVASPGLFPYNITRANIGRVRAEGYRNDLLVKHLREFPEPPNLDQNEGVPAMRHAMAAENLYWPTFFTPSARDSIEVVLWNEKRPAEWEKLQDYLSRQRYINNSQARLVTGIVQSHEMTKRFGQWTKQGLLIRIPADLNVRKDVKYRLADSNETPGLSTDTQVDKQNNVK